ncbi:MAG: type II secretion system GspH family protein [Proteobacteria bacterium]|nr:type II secretion system GspH family protein [Pseudomonadota bacterium]
MTMSHLLHTMTRRRRALAARRRAANPNRQAGMTLLEIMIVLAIIALVMGLLVGPVVFEQFGSAQEDIARTEMKQLVHQAYPQWGIKYKKSCPQSLQDLTEFTNKKDINDPWGNEYAMHCGDNKPSSARFGVSSKGPDGQDGTDDDIKSWEDKKQ